MNFFIYAEICPYKDTGGGLKENVSTEKHYYGLFRDNRDISGLTLHKRQHDYTGNQGRQSSLCFGSPVPRQRTCKLWERGNWRLTTHFFFLWRVSRNNLIQRAVNIWGNLEKIREILMTRLYFSTCSCFASSVFYWAKCYGVRKSMRTQGCARSEKWKHRVQFLSGGD